MIILQWCKMQILCLLILLYVGYIYIREGLYQNKVIGSSGCNPHFDILFIFADAAVLFDGITACTVNYTDQISRGWNLALHLGMFLAYDFFAIFLFLYWFSVTVEFPKKPWMKAMCVLPGAVAIGLAVWFLPELEFVEGAYTNYSMGKSVYACFTCVVVYWLQAVILVILKYRYIPKKKMRALATTLVCVICILLLQVAFPEYLVTGMAVALITISIYLNMENPTIRGLEHYQHEMVMGFATLIENKDDSTGGHIRRSSSYAVLIAKKLRKNEKYKDVITRDYLDNLAQSAPMHDIGKVGIPDAILQKPGKLTEEEYEQMKEHPVIGGRIIRDTFGHLYNGEYESMAYQVAMYHHEKWNGKGYPEGLSGTDIPLCARIMAVADVFDAVSAKRCYRDALPLQKCYEIIESGRGTDFDPDVVDAFMKNNDNVEEIYYKNR